MPARIGPGAAIAQPFVVLGRRQWVGSAPVADRDDRQFLAGKRFFYQDGPAGVTEGLAGQIWLARPVAASCRSNR